MEPVHASRQTRDGAPRSGRVTISSPGGGLDYRRAKMHPAPACPPRVGGTQSLDQHRTRLFFDSYPRLSVQCSQRKTRGQECVRKRLVKLARIRDLAIIDFEFEHLFGVRLILPLDSSRGYPRI